ncbi:MAG: cyclic nucleotide-binding domain-containing protein [Oscillatoriales cyanobacterium SM2_1_8]|nr:cyclic nucleotide-binding domain-containing protein [Oscillatoriales cyanobacterium SM2_1_8]
MKKALFILSALNNDDLDWIVEKGRKLALPPNKILIHEHQPIDALYIVLSGLLKVTIAEDRELAQIGSGEVVGEISFLDSRLPLATVQAVTESLVLEVPRFQITNRLRQDAEFAARFYEALSLCLADRIRSTVGRLGYGQEQDLTESQLNDFSQEKQSQLQLAEIKFHWLATKAHSR